MTRNLTNTILLRAQRRYDNVFDNQERKSQIQLQETKIANLLNNPEINLEPPTVEVIADGFIFGVVIIVLAGCKGTKIK